MAFDFSAVKHILTCPVTKTDLVFHESSLVCCDPHRRLQYPVQSEIPRLLEDDSLELDQETWQEVMKLHDRDPSTGKSTVSSAT